MSDYAFVHEGRAYTPNRTALEAGQADAHNEQIEARELAEWQGQPERQLGYYKFPAEQDRPLPRVWRTDFAPSVTGATVTTWRGQPLGVIVAARVYTHNFGGRMVSLTIAGNNGARYHGRASWDNGSCVWLRRMKGKE